MNPRMIEHYPDLVRTARHGGLNREDAEEVAQDALVLLFRKSVDREVEVLSVDSIQNRAGQIRSLRGWLRDVVGLLLRNRARHRARYTSPLISLDRMVAEPEAPTCEREIELLEFGASVFALLDDSEARLLRLDLLGYKSHEIAHELGVPASTVRVRKKRLLDRLRQETSVVAFAEELHEDLVKDPGERENPMQLEPSPDRRNGSESDERDDEDRRGGPGDPGGSRSAGGDPPHMDEGAPAVGEAASPRSRLSSAQLGGLLSEYGDVCRERGLDPWPAARSRANRSGNAITVDVPKTAAGDALGTIRTLGLRWLAPMTALALGVLFIALADRSGDAPIVLSVPDRTPGSATLALSASTGQPAADWTALRNQVDVAILPDLPPTIEIFGEGRHAESRFVGTQATGGGGLLQTDISALYRL